MEQVNFNYMEETNVKENNVNRDINEITIVMQCQSMMNCFKHIEYISEDDNPMPDILENEGSLLIHNIGVIVSEYVGEKLYEGYGYLALVSTKPNGKHSATFRSPLRKIKDCFVIRQMVALSLDMTKEEMMYYVNGSKSEEEFIRFMKNHPR